MRSFFSILLNSQPAIRSPCYRNYNHGYRSFEYLANIFSKLFRSNKNAPSGMDIPKDRFAYEALRLLYDIADSHFIAFDFEFSGIAERNRDRAGKPTLQERYEETRQSVHEYQPLQIGLTIAKSDEKNGRYILEPYNFDLSPLPLLRERQFTRKWSMNSGAVSFLQRNGFDFGKQMLHGVPYLSMQEESVARAKMTADSRRNDMTLKPDDQILVDHIHESISNWQSQQPDEQAEYLNIPHDSPRGIPASLNAYQRRLVHQIIQNEYPTMKSQGMGHFIQVTNPTSDQSASMAQLEEEQRERDLSRAIGFRWVIDGIIGRDLSKIPEDYLMPALKDTDGSTNMELTVKSLLQDLNTKLQARRKVLIGHNCMVDVMFLYRMTVGDLPPTVEEFRDKLHDLFPAIIDTKYISNCFSEKYGRLSLGEVERDLSHDDSLPMIHTPASFSRYAQTAFLHEAGYDSYITAKVAIQMSSMLHVNGSARKKDHDRQQQQLDEANEAADSLPEFGVQDGYVTATGQNKAVTGDTVTSESSPSDTKNTLVRTIKNFFTLQAQPDTSEQRTDTNNKAPSAPSDNASTNPPPASSVIAVKQTAQPKGKNASLDWRDESAVANVRSAFASTSVYDALDDNTGNSAMPGDIEPPDSQATETESTQEKMDRMVKEGKMMPRWHEEGPFWEIYGNQLQVNGTVEGSMRLVD